MQTASGVLYELSMSSTVAPLLNFTSAVIVNATTKYNPNAIWSLDIQIVVPIVSVLLFMLGELALYIIDDPGLQDEKRRVAKLLDVEGFGTDDADSDDKSKKKRHGSRVVSDAEQPKSGVLSKRSDASSHAEAYGKHDTATVKLVSEEVSATRNDTGVIADIAKENAKANESDEQNKGNSHEIAIQCTLIGEADCRMPLPASDEQQHQQLRRVVTDLQLEKPTTRANQTQVLLSAYLLKRPAHTGSQQRVSTANDSKQRRLRAQSACEPDANETSTYHTWHIGDLPSKRRMKNLSVSKEKNAAEAAAKLGRVESGTKLGDEEFAKTKTAQVGSGSKLGHVDSGGRISDAAIKRRDSKGNVKKVDSRTNTAEKHVTLKLDGEEIAPSSPGKQQLKFTVGDTADERAHEAVNNLSYVTVRGLNDVRRYQDGRASQGHQNANKTVVNGGHEMLDRNRNGAAQRTESLSESGNV